MYVELSCCLIEELFTVCAWYYATIPQMYANALIKKAGIYAGQLNLKKCKTCFEKAMAIAPDCTDLYVHKARVRHMYMYIWCMLLLNFQLHLL